MLIIIECTLWQTADARRRAVGQIVYYGMELATWDYPTLGAAATTPDWRTPSTSTRTMESRPNPLRHQLPSPHLSLKATPTLGVRAVRHGNGTLASNRYLGGV